MAVLRPWQWFVLMVAGAATLFTFQGSRTLTEHEVFAAEPAREMLQGKGWLLQPFAGEVRTKKPPGQSWLIAASLAATRSHSEWAARLPSALSGIGLAVVTAVIAARLGSSRQGLIAGLMTLTCVGVQQRARLAEADMALAFGVAVANAIALRRLLPPARGPRRRPLSHFTASMLFWSCVAAGFLIKGPIVFGFTLLPVVVAWAVLRFTLKDTNAATTLRLAAFRWPAVVAGMAVIIAWPVAAGIQHPEAVAQWDHEIVDRLLGNVGHVDPTAAFPASDDAPENAPVGIKARRDSIFAYGLLTPQSTLPWCPFVVPAVVWIWRRRTRSPAVVLLACWTGCGFVVVSLIPQKVLHYILPAIVPVLVLAAFGFDRLLTQWLRRRPKTSRAGWESAALGGWFGVATVGWLVWSGAVVPSKDWATKVKAFAHRVDAVVPTGETVYLYHPTAARTGEDHTAWYLFHPLRQTTVVPDARPAFLICGSDDANALAGTHSATVLEAAESVTAHGGTERNDRALVRIDRR